MRTEESAERLTNTPLPDDHSSYTVHDYAGQEVEVESSSITLGETQFLAPWAEWKVPFVLNPQSLRQKTKMTLGAEPSDGQGGNGGGCVSPVNANSSWCIPQTSRRARWAARWPTGGRRWKSPWLTAPTTSTSSRCLPWLRPRKVGVSFFLPRSFIGLLEASWRQGSGMKKCLGDQEKQELSCRKKPNTPPLDGFGCLELPNRPGYRRGMSHLQK